MMTLAGALFISLVKTSFQLHRNMNLPICSLCSSLLHRSWTCIAVCNPSGHSPYKSPGHMVTFICCCLFFFCKLKLFTSALLGCDFTRKVISEFSRLTNNVYYNDNYTLEWFCFRANSMILALSSLHDRQRSMYFVFLLWRSEPRKRVCMIFNPKTRS